MKTRNDIARAAFAIAAVTLGLAVGVDARADTPDAIAASAGCSGCHAKDKKVLGPSYADIAAKYRGNAGASTALAAKVRSGGKGVWGAVPMPPMDAETISDADLRTVVAWILKP